MFTGIIEQTARVLTSKGNALILERPSSFKDLREGASVSVSGACLTVTRCDEQSMAFDAVPETLARTTLGSLAPGALVNLERAMPVSGRFDGHIVQGHVEEAADVIALTPNPSPGAGEGRRGEGKVLRGSGKLKYPTSTIVQRARRLRQEQTQAEKIMWEQLRSRRFEGIHFRRQRPIGSHIVDFYCQDARLGIEIDGDVHVFQKEYDHQREEQLEGRGIHILRFTNREVLNDLPNVLRKIEQTVQKNSSSPGGEGQGERESAELTVKVPKDLLPYVIEKGSIALDGVSLTVARLRDDACTVALVPFTLEHTTLGSLKPGDRVNVETDLVGRYVHRLSLPRQL